MREVFGEHGIHYNSAARANKPTEVGGVAQQPNHDKTIVNKGRFSTGGYPPDRQAVRRTEACGIENRNQDQRP